MSKIFNFTYSPQSQSNKIVSLMLCPSHATWFNFTTKKWESIVGVNINNVTDFNMQYSEYIQGSGQYVLDVSSTNFSNIAAWSNFSLPADLPFLDLISIIYEAPSNWDIINPKDLSGFSPVGSISMILTYDEEENITEVFSQKNLPMETGYRDSRIGDILRQAAFFSSKLFLSNFMYAGNILSSDITASFSSVLPVDGFIEIGVQNYSNTTGEINTAGGPFGRITSSGFVLSDPFPVWNTTNGDFEYNEISKPVFYVKIVSTSTIIQSGVITISVSGKEPIKISVPQTSVGNSVWFIPGKDGCKYYYDSRGCLSASDAKDSNGIWSYENRALTDKSNFNLSASYDTKLNNLDVAVSSVAMTQEQSQFLTDIHDDVVGRWVVNTTENTLTKYRENGTILKVYNLVLAPIAKNYGERTPQQ